MTTEAQVTENTEGTQAWRTRKFTLRQRIVILVVSWTAWLIIHLIGPTLRWKYSLEEDAPQEPHPPMVGVFWHRCVIPGLWIYRKWRLAVMTSLSFDGEIIARVIEKFGFTAVRGSSSQGGMRALAEMESVIAQGRYPIFTIDGPRGPRYVAKIGPVLLARATGAPIYCIHFAVDRAWVMNSWDRMIIPKPFAHVMVRVGRLVHLPPNATREEIQKCHQEMQATLDRVREDAERVMMEWKGKNA